MKRAIRGTFAVLREVHGVDHIYDVSLLLVLLEFPAAYYIWRYKQRVIQTAVRHYHANEDANV